MQKITFQEIVADAYSIGDILTERTSPLVISIISAAGFKIADYSPFKLSSSHEELEEDESLDTIAQSIITKKVADGATHIAINLAYGENMKISTLSDAKVLREKLEKLAQKLKVKIRVLIYKTMEPSGKGVGKILEIKDTLKILEQTSDRPINLEIKSLNLACNLLEVCLEDSDKKTKDFVRNYYSNVYNWGLTLLQKGIALEKFKELVSISGGNPNVKSSNLKLAKESMEINAEKTGIVNNINIQNIISIAKILGAPRNNTSGIYINKGIGENVGYGEVLYTLFSENVYNLREGKQSLENFPIIRY